MQVHNPTQQVSIPYETPLRDIESAITNPFANKFPNLTFSRMADKDASPTTATKLAGRHPNPLATAPG
jgi:hypothetical protein